jgi:hypothetical protein
MLAVSDLEHTLRVWNWRGRLDPTKEPRLERPIFQFTFAADVSAIAFSPDSAFLAAVGEDFLKIWDPRNGAIVCDLHAAMAGGASLAFEPHGPRLAVGTRAGEIQIRNVRSGELVGALAGHVAVVSALTFSPNGDRIASGSDDMTIRIWDAQTCDSIAVLRGHEDKVNVVVFSFDGKRLASGSRDKTVRIWETIPISERVVADETSAALRRRAQEKVDALLGETDTAIAAVKKLETMSGIDAALRDAAIPLALGEGDDPKWLAQMVWEIVRLPGNTPDVYRRALRQAERAHRAAPDDLYALFMLGAAQYRVGDCEGAVEHLKESLPTSPDKPNRWPFLVMAHVRLGQTAQAQEVFARLRSLMATYHMTKDPEAAPGQFWDDDESLRILLSEAGNMLARSLSR